MGTYCSKTFLDLPSLMMPFQLCELQISKAVMHPHTISFWTDNKANGHFSLQSGELKHLIKKYETEMFSTLHQSSLTELRPGEDKVVSGSFSNMSSSLHDRALTCIWGILHWKMILTQSHNFEMQFFCKLINLCPSSEELFLFNTTYFSSLLLSLS